jgi:2-keto-4-pentenoate hydratase/2-oxohepta-3-ene-1,7-dioic acid hydratase in catechol pathway
VGKILCLVRNYSAHAEEFDQEVPPEPVFFLKPSTSIVHDGGDVVMPSITSDLQAEAELGVVIGSRVRKVAPEDAYESVLGYCALLDITARDLQRRAIREGLPWSLAKGMDTFAPVSTVQPKDAVGDPDDLEIVLKVNGETRQRASTGQMVFKVPDVVAFLSTHMTLDRGDIIATGTPEGVPKIRPGDELEVHIQRVGGLRVRVIDGP